MIEKNMAKIKKILTIVSLATMGASVLILILGIFGLDIFSGTLSKILLTLSTFAVASFFCINSLNVYNKNKILALVSMGLLALLTVLALFVYWLELEFASDFVKALVILAMATIFFILIVSNSLTLGKKYRALQVISYILILVVDILLTLLVVGVEIFSLPAMTEIFATICLVVFALLCTLKILTKKSVGQGDKTVMIDKVVLTKAEYDALLNKIEELENENKRLKGIDE